MIDSISGVSVPRTKTVAGLMLESGFTRDEAIAVLTRKWVVLEKRNYHPRTPETRAQIQFIRTWKGGGAA